MAAESKHKCQWLTCYAGSGLAGTEHCFAGGDSQNPDCPEYKNEEDFLEEWGKEVNSLLLTKLLSSN